MKSFQFPLSERTNCNNRPQFPSSPYNRLSVSSIGTNELQLLRGWTQTRFGVVFQFPLSERTNCNVKRGGGRPGAACLSVSSIGTNELQRSLDAHSVDLIVTFQFPLSERTNCNRRNKTMGRHRDLPFSFLYRNERTATFAHARGR